MALLGGGGAKSYASVHVTTMYIYIYMSLRTCKHWRGGVGVPHWCGGTTTVEATVMATAATAARQENPWRAAAGAHARPSPSTRVLSHGQLPRSNPRLTFDGLRNASRFFSIIYLPIKYYPSWLRRFIPLLLSGTRSTIS